MTRKTSERLLVSAAAVILVLVALACKRSAPSEATVVCTGASGGISCIVTHVSGNTAINACWDLQYECANGVSVKGTGFCQTVQPGSKAEKLIPLTDLTNADKCDKTQASKVLNLKLTAAP